jgi:aminoglycoside phosphotransferase (APT) family kinase protein
VDDPVVLHDLFSLRVHLRPAPVVARVPTWVTRLVPSRVDRLGHEVAAVEHLVARGAPVVPPSAELPPGPHERDGFAISFWTWAAPDPDRPATAEDCTAMLPDLHAALSDYAGPVADLVRDVVDLPALVAAMDRADHRLAPDDVALLRQAADGFTLPTGATTVLHGDAHPGNVLRSGGELLWIDFEDVALGPPEWDMATMHDEELALARLSPDPARLAACQLLRDLQVALCLAGLDDVFGDTDGWAEGLRWCLDAVRSHLA